MSLLAKCSKRQRLTVPFSKEFSNEEVNEFDLNNEKVWCNGRMQVWSPGLLATRHRMVPYLCGRNVACLFIEVGENNWKITKLLISSLCQTRIIIIIIFGGWRERKNQNYNCDRNAYLHLGKVFICYSFCPDLAKSSLSTRVRDVSTLHQYSLHQHATFTVLFRGQTGG